MKRLLALMLCAVSIGVAAQIANGFCCDPNAPDYVGFTPCAASGEPYGTYSDFDGAVCDPDCEGYNPSDPSCFILGCTDPTACNYDPSAVVDLSGNSYDGYCLQLDAIGVCGGPCMADVNSNGICDDQEISGCTDEWACNYDSSATLDDGSCEDSPEPGCACYDYYCPFCDLIDLVEPGCADPQACNYDDLWQLEGCLIQSCEYADALGVCGGDCVSDYNNNGVCDNEEVFGCTYADALNFNPNATDDDGSCISPCVGEVNTNVFDWNGDYNVSIADFLMMLSVFGDADVDFDGVWDSSDECIDTDACNFDFDPSEPCAYIDVLGVCGGGCEGDGDNDGICDDVDDCIGVVDECGVCNGPGPTQVVIDDIIITYDSVFLPLDEVWFVYAVDADTLISYECEPTCGSLSTSTQYTLTVESSPAVDPALGTTYRFYINLEDATDQVSAVYGNNQATLEVNAPDGVYNSAFNASWSASGINPAFLTVSPELAADTYATIGLTGPASTSGIAGAADPAFVEDELQPMVPFFQNHGETSLLCNTQIGSSWFVLNTATNASPQDGSLRVLVMQVTSTGNVSGQLNYQIYPQGNYQTAEQYLTPFDGTGAFQGQLFEEVIGCMNEGACNFDPCANLQPIGFCTFPNANGDCE